VELIIPSYGQVSAVINIKSPESPGIYTVVASLERDNEKPVKSTREIAFK
jgi:hypothetical protein